MPSTATRRPRKAKKAILVVDAIAAAEPEVALEKPKRVRRAVKKQQAEPVSAAHAALLAAIEASADGGVIYERAEIASTARAESPVEDSSTDVPARANRRRVEESSTDVPARANRPRVAPVPRTSDAESSAEDSRDQIDAPSAGPSRLNVALKALDGLPPIRLPIGPAIPWRFGVPALAALVLVMFVFGRPTAHADSGFKLPAESETYAVTQDSPLFTQTQAQQQPIGVPEPAGLNVDVLDLTLKLVAVLALAYGSLVVLKRLGIGGAGTGSVSSSGTSSEGLRVLSTLALAPNRSIHVVRAPDGKTLLLGATPGQVNLITELGEVPEVAGLGPGSFFDILTSKLQH